jgi:hypothetical protein
MFEIFSNAAELHFMLFVAYYDRIVSFVTRDIWTVVCTLRLYMSLRIFILSDTGVGMACNMSHLSCDNYISGLFVIKNRKFIQTAYPLPLLPRNAIHVRISTWNLHCT